MSEEKNGKQEVEETTASPEVEEAQAKQEAELEPEKYAVQEGQDEKLPLKDRVLVIKRSQVYRLSFQEMHDMRAMYLKEAENAGKEIARAEEKRAGALESAAKWESEIAKVVAEIPELEKESGIVSPIQQGDLDGGDEDGGEAVAA